MHPLNIYIYIQIHFTLNVLTDESGQGSVEGESYQAKNSIMETRNQNNEKLTENDKLCEMNSVRAIKYTIFYFILSVPGVRATKTLLSLMERIRIQLLLTFLCNKTCFS